MSFLCVVALLFSLSPTTAGDERERGWKRVEGGDTRGLMPV